MDLKSEDLLYLQLLGLDLGNPAMAAILIFVSVMGFRLGLYLSQNTHNLMLSHGTKQMRHRADSSLD